MEQHGFIRDMLDVKVLILFVASRAQYPMTLQKVYELCFQDDKLSYFDVSIAVPQMVETGHLQELDKDILSSPNADERLWLSQKMQLRIL
ncbi:MAG: DUF4364 family protein [Oscillospiraceae bacterium]|nr:DUF4364 family protein [Oscillospiraceae bacterium]